jgi:tetraacyldisaccharide-1-P 4'-kinase
MKCKIVKQLNFKDHSNYNQRKWNNIEALCLKLNVEFILTTEKDWIKIENLKTKVPIIVLGLKIGFNNSGAFYTILKSIN